MTLHPDLPPPCLQVKAAFFQLAQVHHPDIAGEGEVARENFAAITLAYNCLRWGQAEQVWRVI